MTNLIEEAAGPCEAAAAWWAAQLGSPIHRQVRDGERTASTDFAAMGMALISAGNAPLTAEQANRFTELLTATIAKQLAKRIGWYERDPESDPAHASISLGVDYGPDLELAEAAEGAGITGSMRFPIKTNMWVRQKYVTAARGYGARATLVWGAPGWERPVCGDHRYNRATQDYLDEVCPLPRWHEGQCDDWKPDPERCGSCGKPYSVHYSVASFSDRSACRDWHQVKRVAA